MRKTDKRNSTTQRMEHAKQVSSPTLGQAKSGERHSQRHRQLNQPISERSAASGNYLVISSRQLGVPKPEAFARHFLTTAFFRSDLEADPGERFYHMESSATV